MQRGEIWWADLDDPIGSGPGYRRPVLVIQSDSFNESRIQTVIIAVITGNLRLAEAPGNVTLGQRASGLGKESVVNVSQIMTIDRTLLSQYAGTVSAQKMAAIDQGLRSVLSI